MQKTIIQNKNGIDLKSTFSELYEYKELLWTLAWRDIKVKYAQTFLGFTWAIIEPLITSILLSLVFNKVAKAPTQNIEPILFAMSGMLVWNYFSNVANQGNTSLIMAQNMIKKIYFPRIIIPVSKAIASLPDLLITIAFTFILLLIYQPSVSIKILLFLIPILLTVICATSVGIWLGALNIRFRDFKHIAPFILRIGLFLTPIAYSTVGIEAKYKWLFFLNPMSGIIELLRWSIFDLPIESNYLVLSLVVLVILNITSLLYFNYMEKNIADII